MQITRKKVQGFVEYLKLVGFKGNVYGQFGYCDWVLTDIVKPPDPDFILEKVLKIVFLDKEKIYAPLMNEEREFWYEFCKSYDETTPD